VALAERLGEAKIATLDQRHFRTVRPAHVEALELRP
jgi:predicted nucleic acid-binding protein